MSNAGRPKLSPEQVETIARVWLATANASEAARQAECSPQSACRTIIRLGLDSSGKLYADALARAEREHLALVAKARGKVAAALDGADDPEDVAELTRAASDSLRAVTATRIAHLKVTGLSAPDRTDVTSGGEKLAQVVMLPALDGATNVRTEAPASAVGPEPGATD